MCDSHDDLPARVAALEAALHAERAVGEVIAEGNTTLSAMAAALRKRASTLMAPRAPGFAGHLGIFEHPSDVERRMWLGTELLALANEIEEGN